jgi:hypothetical protein
MAPWTPPSDWYGDNQTGNYVLLSRHRDSDDLTESNFATALAMLGGESASVRVIRESHWAVGWLETILIAATDIESVRIGNEIAASLADYPVLDESDWSERETASADTIWRDCYDWRDRIAYIRKHRDSWPDEWQLPFRDMLATVRGRFFGGDGPEIVQ